MVQLNKKDWRVKQKKSLKSYQGVNRSQEERALRQLLLQMASWKTAKRVALTLSLPFELDTQPLIKAAWQANKQVVVPQIKNQQMAFVEITPQTSYQVGPLGILEPCDVSIVQSETIDLVITPGLAFTKTGKRLGFGAGYYDRFLVNYAGPTVALALSCQIVPDLPQDKYDQRIMTILFNDHC
ncbi:5-formyltetrahydrofolate cyclo-ligase [Convivina praedatoris]|uniref:5-formyltetrahydrofolate cyclo-ligase n=1 Tax=Convivina praedatoris TaxID=2880963 RepID=A0ABM9D1H2_9LACO|nr:5-formyltetrahydrofolate cyclo-ligase [Convivina sp. LMG 32447]CAH1851931.1 putative protein YqgN [Convivina sp. LMG 32447]CAH1853987.1 putative protein YqgN [Convivina sp. LMG 32447]CAH1854028.1 putative protein YqgN [Convivina sp. LMG 32447]